jgi:hypothetical protein
LQLKPSVLRAEARSTVNDLEAKIASSERASFGSGVPEEVIAEAEEALGVQFPKSYRWWLAKYGSGYLNGYELQGLCPMRPSERDPADHYVGDVVCMTRINRGQGTPSHLLELLNYEGDEVYFLDLLAVVDGEAPVVVGRPGTDQLDPVATSFAAFLESEL